MIISAVGALPVLILLQIPAAGGLSPVGRRGSRIGGYEVSRGKIIEQVAAQPSLSDVLLHVCTVVSVGFGAGQVSGHPAEHFKGSTYCALCTANER